MLFYAHLPQCYLLGFGTEWQLGDGSPVNRATNLRAVPCLYVKRLVLFILIFITLYDCLDYRFVIDVSLIYYLAAMSLRHDVQFHA